MATMNVSREMLDRALAESLVADASAVSVERLPDDRPALQIELESANGVAGVIASLTLRFNEQFGWAWAMCFADRAGIEQLHNGRWVLQYIDVELGYRS